MMLTLAELVKELKNDKKGNNQKNLEGYDVVRCDNNNPNHNLSSFNVQSKRLKIEYEAVLTDPRRI